jgi:hypothetical protein
MNDSAPIFGLFQTKKLNRGPNAYDIFKKDQMKKRKKEIKELSGSEFNREIDDVWTKMPGDKKKEFTQKANRQAKKESPDSPEKQSNEIKSSTKRKNYAFGPTNLFPQPPFELNAAMVWVGAQVLSKYVNERQDIKKDLQSCIKQDLISSWIFHKNQSTLIKTLEFTLNSNDLLFWHWELFIFCATSIVISCNSMILVSRSFFNSVI